MHGESRIVIPLLELKEFDQYATTHSMNVAVLAMALAEYMGLDARHVRTFGVAGLLHDLGKVRIPKDILNKPGKLTDEERRIMQRHPSDGARVLIDSDQLDLAATVAYEYHIMIDGGGSPTCISEETAMQQANWCTSAAPNVRTVVPGNHPKFCAILKSGQARNSTTA